jgi:hypothetical protein
MTYIKNQVLYVLIGLTVFSGAVAQPSAGMFQKNPATLLKQDLRVLRDSLQKLHPGLHRNQSKARIDQLFDSCYEAIRDRMAVTDFYVMIR